MEAALMDVRGPDGKTVRFPDGTDPGKIDEVMSSIYVAKAPAAAPAATPAPSPSRSWGSTALSALQSAPSSAMNLVGGIAHSIAHPVETAGTTLSALAGGARNAAQAVLPTAAFDFLKQFENNPAAIQKAVTTANAVGGAYKAKYGSVEGFKNALATDPVGVAADISTVMSMGAAATARGAPAISSALRTGAKFTNPVNAITPVVSVPLKAVGKGAGAVINATAPKSPASIIAETLNAQGTSPSEVGQMIQDAKAKGVPLALMDTGDEMRGLASSLARKPGESRTIMRDAVIPRQEGQTERVQGAITRDLGPTANVRAASEALIKDAQQKAAPLYEKAYAAPIPDTEKLQELATRPSMKSALQRAYTIAAEEGRDPKVMGFNLDKSGNVTLEKHNSTQTWDYVKRGLDDVIESHRDATTGRLKMDEGLRAINGTQRDFIKEMDRVNPAYGAARAAYAGPAKMATALAKGAKIGNKDSETIWAETRDLTKPELEQYKLGVRSALSKMMEGKVDGADKVRALVGTPKKRAVLSQLFGGSEKFDNFMGTLAHEGAAAQTYGRVNTGSMTAANLADDAATDGLTGIAAKAGTRALAGHGIVGNAVHTISDLLRYGHGKSADVLRAQLAAGISETNPVMLSKLVADATAEMERTRNGGRAASVSRPLRAIGKAGKIVSASPVTLGGALVNNATNP